MLIWYEKLDLTSTGANLLCDVVGKEQALERQYSYSDGNYAGITSGSGQFYTVEYNIRPTDPYSKSTTTSYIK